MQKAFAEFSWPVTARGQQPSALVGVPSRKQSRALQLIGADQGCGAKSKR